jgi:hypothetical protein
VDQVIERVHYNCVCDEQMSLSCANPDCGNEIVADSTMLLASDGSVFCSESCADAIAEDGAA